jgi:hypothetical protein
MSEQVVHPEMVRRRRTVAICAALLVSTLIACFVTTSVSSADANCTNNHACFWTGQWFTGNKVEKGSTGTEGTFIYITGMGAWNTSAWNNFDNRKIKVWNNPGYGDPICLNPHSWIVDTGYGDDMWQRGQEGSRCS